MIDVPLEDYEAAVEDYGGWCTNCAAFTASGVEPDAEGYTCEFCEEKTVLGAEQALLEGRISVGEEE